MSLRMTILQMKNNMKNKGLLFLFFLGAPLSQVLAQGPTKEAMNNFALYSNSGKITYLQKAKTLIDGALLNRKDSSNYKNNLTRALIYSSLAYEDSSRTIKYVKDPIEETQFSLSFLDNPKLNDENKPQLDFVNTQLSKAWIVKANRSLRLERYREAYNNYLVVDSISPNQTIVLHNLALLSERLGLYNRAISYFEQLIQDRKRALPEYYLMLANLYESRNSNRAFDVLQEGRKLFPTNRDLLFRLINIYSDNGSYGMVESLIKDAMKQVPEDADLNYLAAFSYDINGKTEKAEELYKKVIDVESDNYNANYSLGLLYLKKYLSSSTNDENYQNLAKKYLTLAGEINPNSVKVLKSLALLYNKSGDMVEQEKINNKLKQFIQ